MLIKEEIEKAKQCLKETIENTYAEGKAIKLNNALNYIEQLETAKDIKESLEFANIDIKTLIHFKHENEKLKSDKQKLIEKLEEQANRKTPIKDADYVQGYRDLARDLLEILKGENDE